MKAWNESVGFNRRRGMQSISNLDRKRVLCVSMEMFVLLNRDFTLNKIFTNPCRYYVDKRLTKREYLRRNLWAECIRSFLSPNNRLEAYRECQFKRVRLILFVHLPMNKIFSLREIFFAFLWFAWYLPWMIAFPLSFNFKFNFQDFHTWQTSHFTQKENKNYILCLIACSLIT